MHKEIISHHALKFLVLFLVVTPCHGFISSSRKPRAFNGKRLFPTILFSQPDTISKEPTLRTLYPPATLQNNGTLKVDEIHTIYYEEYSKHGNRNSNENNDKQKTVALSLHGGPGAGSFPKHAQFFDPEKYERVVLFDQRGCGRSTPRGETKFNTLEYLVEDVEKLRIHLEIDKFDVVLGGSWGSTLALAYSQNFPERVGSLVLRGVCLFRPEEINWLFGHEERKSQVDDENDNTNCISNRGELGEAWKFYKQTVQNDGSDSPVGTRGVLHKYYNRLLGTDAIARALATKSWFRWEFGVSSFKNITSSRCEKEHDGIGVIKWSPASQQWQSLKGQIGKESIESLRRWPQRSRYLHTSPSNKLVRVVPNEVLVYNAGNLTNDEAKTFIPAQTMLTCYYSVNDEYMMSNFQLLSKENIDKIRHIPCIAVQGAKDLICPPDSALDLVENFPEMECRIVVDGKHSMYDPLISSELIKATDSLADHALFQ